VIAIGIQERWLASLFSVDVSAKSLGMTVTEYLRWKAQLHADARGETVIVRRGLLTVVVAKPGQG
jgi:hypothetical protein